MSTRKIVQRVLHMAALSRSYLRYRKTVREFLADESSVLILRYHSVARKDNGYTEPGISIEPDRFRDHLRFLRLRYEIIGLDEVLERIRTGRSSTRRPAVALTFDDGYRDNLTEALPVLVDHEATATVYMVAGCIRPAAPIWNARLNMALDRTAAPTTPCPLPVALRFSNGGVISESRRGLVRWLRGLRSKERERRIAELLDWLGVDLPHDSSSVMMSAEELKTMYNSGVAVGSHTWTHPLLTEIPLEDAREEIESSRRELTRLLGDEIRHFSYPNPGGGIQVSPAVRELVRTAGYRSATVSRHGLVRAGSDPLAMHRVGVNRGRQEQLLFRALGLRGSAPA